MKKVYILKGLPASGKSTWSRQQLKEHPNSYKRINKDDLRAMLDDNHWSRGNEKFVLTVRDLMIKEALKAGKHVISDDTNLAPKHETRIRQIVREYCNETGEQVEVVVKYFDVELEECIRRDLGRTRSVAERVIRSMYKQFIDKTPQHPEPLVQDKSLPKAIICDLDGTLAILDRNPYKTGECEKDRLNVPIANMVKTYKQLGYQILIVSGRREEFLPQSKNWLTQHEIPYDFIAFRKNGDRGKDSMTKAVIFENEIKGKWYVEFVLDDRNQVVEMWRKLGLTCYQVARGDF